MRETGGRGRGRKGKDKGPWIKRQSNLFLGTICSHNDLRSFNSRINQSHLPSILKPINVFSISTPTNQSTSLFPPSITSKHIFAIPFTTKPRRGIYPGMFPQSHRNPLLLLQSILLIHLRRL